MKPSKEMAERSQENKRLFKRLMAASVVVVAVILTLFVISRLMTLGHTHPLVTPTAIYSKWPYTNGQKVTIESISELDVVWDAIIVQLSDGVNFADWETATADLDGGHTITHNYTTDTLGATRINVCCLVTDVNGNGVVSRGDYFTVFTYEGSRGLTSGTSYTACLIYTETGDRIGTGVTWTAS